MALLEINWKPTRRDLRQFAGLWVLFFGLIGAYCRWISLRPTAAAALWFVAAAGLFGLGMPGVMRPVYVVWMAAALPVGWIVSHLMLVTVYYAVLTPVGLMMKILRYDPLARKYDRPAKTYWIEHDPAAERSRYFKQY